MDNFRILAKVVSRRHSTGVRSRLTYSEQPSKRKVRRRLTTTKAIASRWIQQVYYKTRRLPSLFTEVTSFPNRNRRVMRQVVHQKLEWEMMFEARWQARAARWIWPSRTCTCRVWQASVGQSSTLTMSRLSLKTKKKIGLWFKELKEIGQNQELSTRTRIRATRMKTSSSKRPRRRTFRRTNLWISWSAVYSPTSSGCRREKTSESA